MPLLPTPSSGIVLLSPYSPALFERLELTDKNIFRSKEAQVRAVHYLHYVATGDSHADESQLVLMKILCGLTPSAPVSAGIEISEEEKKLIGETLHAAIVNWEAIKNISIEGLREVFLMRKGLINYDEDRWTLTVERQALDLLKDQLPYATSVIRYPWMEKVLYVNWN